MNSGVYEELASALDKVPCGYPRTRSGIELEILRRLFSPEEALAGSYLTATSEPVDIIAERAHMSREELGPRLGKMLGRGLIWGSKKEGVEKFRLAPIVVGFYEEQRDIMDHDLAHLFEQYFTEGGLSGIMSPSPAIFRVVPARQAVKPEVILPYDDVKSLLLQARQFTLRDCLCRMHQDMLGERKCNFPLQVCLSFSGTSRPPGPHDISQEEALKVLDKTEEIGLVHTVNNLIRGVYFVCNCCGCCCMALRGITQFGIANSVARANYYAVVDGAACNACGICAKRCQVGACTVDDVATIDLTKCIGCGLCVTGCPDEAVTLALRPEAERVTPPEDNRTWERLRLRHRGLIT
ncbi:MAG: 4Fe-4S binding protein [Chloroflexi bacterium]|nr:4Fe-4S binding protein [Chloroflexota bacterium]